MRQLRLTIWHLLLVALIVVGSITGVLAGVRTFLQEWEHPWLLPLLMLVTVDAVITQWLVERERQSWTEQIAIRSAEALLLIVATRIASLLAEDAPLSAMHIWLRDPLAFLSGRFAEYLLLVAFTWIVSTWLVHHVIQLDTAPPPPSVREHTIDQAVLLNERTLALVRFDKLWISLLVLGLAGAVIALYRTPLLQIIGSWRSFQLLLAVLGCALAGVLLHSEGHLDFVRFRWQIDQLDVSPTVTQRWRRTSWLMAAGAIVLALLLGGLFNRVPAPPPLEPVLNILVAVLILLTWLVVVVIGLVLFPFIWLLSLFRSGESAPPMRFEPPPLPPIEQMSGERPLLPALIFWGCVALLIGIAVLRYVQQRDDVRALLERWRGWRWIMRLWGDMAADLRGWSELALETLQRLRRPRRPTRTRRKSTRSERAEVRAIYRRMVRLASHRGVLYRTSQTPYEFSQTLEAAVPLIDDETHALTDAFVTSEYGPEPPSKGEVRQVQKIWRRIERVLRRR